MRRRRRRRSLERSERGTRCRNFEGPYTLGENVSTFVFSPYVQAASEADLRRRKKTEYNALLLEKQQELERLTSEYESLLKVKQEQDSLIAELSSSG